MNCVEYYHHLLICCKNDVIPLIHALPLTNVATRLYSR